jgi:hypothetical protein
MRLVACSMAAKTYRRAPVDVHLHAFAADAGVTRVRYEQLRAVYEETAAILAQRRANWSTLSGGSSRNPCGRSGGPNSPNV